MIGLSHNSGVSQTPTNNSTKNGTNYIYIQLSAHVLYLAQALLLHPHIYSCLLLEITTKKNVYHGSNKGKLHVNLNLANNLDALPD